MQFSAKEAGRPSCPCRPHRDPSRRTRGVSQARRVICQLAVGHLGYTGTAVARFLGVT